MNGPVKVYRLSYSWSKLLTGRVLLSNILINHMRKEKRVPLEVEGCGGLSEFLTVPLETIV